MRPQSAWFLAVLFTATPLFAGDPSGRVRCLDTESRQLVEKVSAQSPTVRRMLARLEASDLITYIQITPSFQRLRATTRIIGTVPEARFVLVTIVSMTSETDRIQLIGHELQHVLELAEAPTVRDEAGMVEMYERIGWRESSRAYETAAAVDAGRTVKLEVLAANRQARNATVAPGMR